MSQSRVRIRRSMPSLASAFSASSAVPIALATFIALALAGQMATAADQRPNIVLIMADDVSWECFGSYGAEDYQTPRLDALARKGIQFNHCYSTPICTTSRVKLMTGQYNFRNYTHFGYLAPGQKTFANLLKQAGYRSAIAGKWQLNGLYNKHPGHDDNTRPYQAGFDEYMLWQLTKGKPQKDGGGERFWSPVLEYNRKYLGIEENEGKYGPDMLCDFLCEFIARDEEKPFFVYYPMVLVHNPFVPTPDTIGDRSRGHESNKPVSAEKKENFVAMVAYMDKIVGRLVDQLEQSNKLYNTIILFTADNGTNTAITSTWKGQKIKGGKGGMTDMGTHVPLIAYWKGHTPSGTISNELIDFTDFYPTFAEAAGLSLDNSDPRDGVSFYSQLIGEKGPRRNWVLNHYQPYWNKTPGQFARTQQYKLYRDGRFFDIGSGDLKEERPLSDEARSGTVASSHSKLSAVLESAPPAPRGRKNAETPERPIYPDWSKLPEHQN